MKDYRTNKKEKNDYILGVKKLKSREGKNTLAVNFADGRRFSGYEYNDENLSKVMARQEEQANEGIKNIGVFKRRQFWSEFATTLSTCATTGTYGLIAEKALENSTNEAETLAACICGGCLVLANIIIGGYFINKNHSIVGELEKINFRNEHRDTLEQYRNYPNATVGLSKSQVEYLEEVTPDCDPFNIMAVEMFSKKDLETIVENVKTEEKLDFKYAPKAQTYQKK